MPSDSNPYAPPVAATDVENEVDVENALEQRVAFAKTEEAIKGIGIVAFCISFASAFSIYLVWHANRLELIGLFANALPCVLLLIAGVMLRGLNAIGRIVFSVAIALTLGGSVMVIDARPDFQLSILFLSSPQLVMAGYLFMPRVQVVCSHAHREGVVRQTPEVMLNTPRWAWPYGAFVAAFMMSVANHRIHH